MKPILTLCLLFAGTLALHAKNYNIDSLLAVYHDTSIDPTERCKALNKVTRHFKKTGDFEKGLAYADTVLMLASEIDNHLFQGLSYENKGLIHLQLQQLDEASEFFLKSAHHFELAEDYKSVSGSIGNVGICFFFKGELDSSLVYFEKSYEIQVEIQDTAQMMASLGNIGALSIETGDYHKAVKYMNETLILANLQGDTLLMASTLANIGNAHNRLDEHDKAIESFEQALALQAAINNTEGVAIIHDNLSGIYFELEDTLVGLDHLNKAYEMIQIAGGPNLAQITMSVADYLVWQNETDSAEVLFSQALEMAQASNMSKQIALANVGLATIALSKKNYSEALKYANAVKPMVEEIDVIETKMSVYEVLYEANKENGNYSEALQYFEEYTSISNELNNEDNLKAILGQSLDFQYKAKALQDSIQAVKDEELNKLALEAEKAETDRQKERGKYLIVLLSLAVASAFFIFNRLRVTKKQKQIIDKQKVTVENTLNELAEKNQEIVDSINYALRIQTALLPEDIKIKKSLKKHFIFYNPKDVVSGDFYWYAEKDNRSYFAVADCTGHGVPGAMVSVVCNNALNRAVAEFDLVSTSEILNKTREIVISELNQGNETVKDGMDISLCSFDANTGSVTFTGAHNSLYLIRNKELIEYKGDRSPVGLSDNPAPFSHAEIKLEENDMVYLSTDGFIDQFGGVKGKKLKSKGFKELLVTAHEMNMEEQLSFFEDSFKKWKGNFEQLDDVTVFGFKYNA
jgi:serine phosphatase RsbU (regulator of sigma subunit)/Tfp pilus assembly protein PilF